ncbi:MAG: amidohydrolase family protein [Acidobacteriota bacterium]
MTASLRPLGVLLSSCLLAGSAFAETERPVRPPAHAFVGVHALIAPGRELPGATLIIRDGRIEDVGVGLQPPADAVVHDGEGMVAWPGLFEPHLGLSKLGGEKKGGGDDDDDEERPGHGHANAKVHPELRVASVLQPKEKGLKSWWKQGFTTAAVVPDSGIFRGRGAVVELLGGPLRDHLIEEGTEIHAAFEAGGWGSNTYPNSVMGATAVLRQGLLDGRWYEDAWAWSKRHARAPRPENSSALAALADAFGERSRSRARLAFDCRSVLDALRAGELADEFGIPFRVIGSGDEHRRLNEVARLGVPVVLPLDFPAPPAATTEWEWLEVSDRRLEHWDRAPDTPRWLDEMGVEVSLSTKGLKTDELSAVPGRVRRAIERGLPEATAMAMLTTRPAKLHGVDHLVGTLEPGKLAHFVLSHGRPFEKGRVIREVWIGEERRIIERQPEGPKGKWDVTLTRGGKAVEGTLSLKAGGGSFSWKPDPSEKKREKAKLEGLELVGDAVSFDLKVTPWDAEAEDSVGVEASVDGHRMTGTGPGITLSGRRVLGPQPPDEPPTPRTPAPRPKPFGGPLDHASAFVIRNATLWTAADVGVLGRADLLVRDGRIQAIGSNLRLPRGGNEVDGTGLHVTPGLIDAHSHSAIVGGVNEGTNSCTAEVRIGDVVNSETLSIYRLLAGGLTTAHLLHGSANSMGGQAQTIKLRWGATPEGLKLQGAKPTIKFALGENVKQANWGEEYTTRFPQSRMGVEQFMRVKFHEAREHAEAHRDWGSGGERDALPPRPNLQLDALADILRGDMWIHCHSYRQDEILMLVRLAEELGFTMGTFQHVLEGYKVADELAAHGAHASSFSDWWAYKFEVYDAIPHNGALMWERGVNVTFNSDSTELARRMNLEAAKAVRSGGVPPEEALKFVTINAAIQMGVDHRIGSLEVGKDADLVLWNGPPMSPASLALQTFVDGRLYFDRAVDLAQREAQAERRAALIAAVEKARDGDGSESKGSRPRSYPYLLKGHDHCLDNAGHADHGHHDEEIH